MLVPSIPTFVPASTTPAALMQAATSGAPIVPFYSQFVDVTPAAWKKQACGVASLAMMIDYYTTAVPVDELLTRGIKRGAYLQGAGWTYKGLIDLSRAYGLTGISYDLAGQPTVKAFSAFRSDLSRGPLIASVHYKFDPKSTIPHLVVITGSDEQFVYYNDPASKKGGEKITVDRFLKAWKKRYIVIRPVS